MFREKASRFSATDEERTMQTSSIQSFKKIFIHQTIHLQRKFRDIYQHHSDAAEHTSPEHGFPKENGFGGSNAETGAQETCPKDIHQQHHCHDGHNFQLIERERTHPDALPDHQKQQDKIQQIGKKRGGGGSAHSPKRNQFHLP